MKDIPAPSARGTLVSKPADPLTRGAAAAVAVRAHDHLRQRTGP